MPDTCAAQHTQQQREECGVVTCSSPLQHAVIASQHQNTLQLGDQLRPPWPDSCRALPPGWATFPFSPASCACPFLYASCCASHPALPAPQSVTRLLPHLSHECVVGWAVAGPHVSLDQPVQGPLDGGHRNVILTACHVGAPKLQHAEDEVGGAPGKGVGALEVVCVGVSHTAGFCMGQQWEKRGVILRWGAINRAHCVGCAGPLAWCHTQADLTACQRG